MAEPSQSINAELAQRVQQATGQNVYLCYQCVKCTSGCPVSEFFDWQPNQIMRAVQLGQEDVALHSQTPWLCASCQTCTTRCPQGLDITAIMEFLTREAKARGFRLEVPEVNAFNDAFMREIKLWGRAYELGLIAEMKLRTLGTRRLTDDVDLGVKMLRKSKLKFLPRPTRAPRHVKPIAGASKSIAYYPGCSLHSTGAEFDTSARAVCEALDMKLIEPRGWVCCGSSAAHRADPDAALRLPLENLSIIEQSGFSEVTMPCAACFNRHKAAQHEARSGQQPAQAAGAAKSIGYTYRDTVQVNTLIETIAAHVGPEKIAAKVQQSMNGLRAVCYYGCLLTRPPQVTQAPHPENPTDMDALMSAIGVEVIDWSYKTSCCGAAHSLTRPDIVLKLSGRLIEHARAAGADVMVVACPLCHANLDARQFQMKLEQPMPILYFTQLMALALGLPDKAALHKNLIDPRPVLQNKGVVQVYH
ncbi:MAG: 4Fe-4S dicluster domain-containing protein [Chloroflexi bacterium]|nr:4Fe-4S dicluster domain-containing protein [Chloroflexota bacterium]